MCQRWCPFLPLSLIHLRGCVLSADPFLFWWWWESMYFIVLSFSTKNKYDILAPVWSKVLKKCYMLYVLQLFTVSSVNSQYKIEWISPSPSKVYWLVSRKKIRDNVNADQHMAHQWRYRLRYKYITIASLLRTTRVRGYRKKHNVRSIAVLSATWWT